MGFIHEHIILPLSDLIRGEHVHHYLRLLHEAEQWDEAQITLFQQEKLRTLIEYAASDVPYYHDWFLEHHLDPKKATLDQLPIVSKQIMRQEGIDRFTANHFPPKQRLSSRSSGSTGEPFSFYNSSLANSVNTAAKLRTWYQAGYHLGMPYMKIANGARHGKLKTIQDQINRCDYIPFYSMDDTVLKGILERIEQKKPRFIRSYPVISRCM